MRPRPTGWRRSRSGRAALGTRRRARAQPASGTSSATTSARGCACSRHGTSCSASRVDTRRRVRGRALLVDHHDVNDRLRRHHPGQHEGAADLRGGDGARLLLLRLRNRLGASSAPTDICCIGRPTARNFEHSQNAADTFTEPMTLKMLSPGLRASRAHVDRQRAAAAKGLLLSRGGRGLRSGDGTAARPQPLRAR